MEQQSDLLPRPAGRASLWGRVGAILMAAALFAAPVLMYSQQVRSFCAHYGNMSVPLAEEEEVHHYNVPPCPVTSDRALRPETTARRGPVCDERAYLAFHGDVPHLPPW